jgi:hypothetical protein
MEVQNSLTKLYSENSIYIHRSHVPAIELQCSKNGNIEPKQWRGGTAGRRIT